MENNDTTHNDPITEPSITDDQLEEVVTTEEVIVDSEIDSEIVEEEDDPRNCYPIVFISKEINHDMAVLDVGCGNKQYSVLSEQTITVDAWDQVDPDFIIDLEHDDLPFGENSFDCVLLLDVIEHLPRDRGEIILEQCLKISRNKVYILTPQQWDINDNIATDPNSWAFHNDYYNRHKSLWTATDFPNFVEVECRHDVDVWFGWCSKYPQSAND